MERAHPKQMKGSLFFIISLLFGTLFLAGCRSTPVEQRELYGLWKANYPDAEDTIEIRGDGTYIHKYSRNGIEPLMNSGKWDLEEVNSMGEQRIGFDNFQGGSLTDRKFGPGYFLPIIERRRGGIILDFDPDANLYYSKIR